MKTIEMPTADTAADGLGPRRLLDGGGDGFERMLVEPSLSERVPRASLERLMRALELPPEALPPDAVETLPSAPTRDASWLLRHAGGLRLGAIGVVAVGLGLTGWRLASREHQATPPPAPFAQEATAATAAQEGREARANVLSAADSRAARSPEPVVGAPARDVEVARALRPPLPTRAPRRAQQPAAAARQLDSSAELRGSSAELRGLSAELRALERVQRALLDRQPSAAASALASYRRQFEHGELALEAELLGVEVALANGDGDGARTRAREIASRPAAARYRARLDALLGAANVLDTSRPAGVKANAAHIESAEVNR